VKPKKKAWWLQIELREFSTSVNLEVIPFVMDGIHGLINVWEHAQVANMVVDNDVIESVVAIVIIGVLANIHITVYKTNIYHAASSKFNNTIP
jgi:hypothetical protein